MCGGGLNVPVMTSCAWIVLVTLWSAAQVVSADVRIVGGPKDRVIQSGSTLKLECVGNGYLNWSYPQYEDQVTPTLVDLDGGKGSKLTIPDASYLDTGWYRCHSSEDTVSVYVFVEDEEQLLVNSPFDSLIATQWTSVIIPCRPSSPTTEVSLYKDGELVPLEPSAFDPRGGYLLRNVSLHDSAGYVCTATRGTHTESTIVHLTVHSLPDTVPKPWINGTEHVVEGGTTTLQCNVGIETDTLCHLEWKLEKEDKGHVVVGRVEPLSDGRGRSCSRNLTVVNATTEQEHLYTCTFTVGDNTESDTKFLRVFSKDEQFLTLDVHTNSIQVTSGDEVKWVVTVSAHPPPTLAWLSPDGKTLTSSDRYEVRTNESQTMLRINEASLLDSGNYTLAANNSAGRQSLTLELHVSDMPRVTLDDEQLYYQLGRPRNFTCKVSGHPLPAVKWAFYACSSRSCSEDVLNEETSRVSELVLSGTHLVSVIELPMSKHGILECDAANALGTTTEKVELLVTEVPTGFLLQHQPEEVVVGDDVTLTCAVPVHAHNSTLRWFRRSSSSGELEALPKGLGTVAEYSAQYSTWSNLTILNMTVSEGATGEFVCQAVDDLGDIRSEGVQITVEELQEPVIFDTNLTETEMVVSTWKPLAWRCAARGYPTPLVTWYKDGELIDPSVAMSHYELQDNNRTLSFKALTAGDDGRYTCRATNKGGVAETFVSLKLKGFLMDITTLIAIVVVVAVILVVLLIALIFSIRKIRRDKMSLRKAGLYHFNEGAVDSLNDELPLDEQTDLLPYNRKFEFARNKLKLGKQLGAGAFGVVFKAEAQGIVEGEDTTTVAVKMVKRDADPAYIKALASELKILVHLGRHLNVVNLLGACTKQIVKRELLVIVEFCHYGNIHNYLLNHRDMFIDQVDRETGEIDITRGSMLGFSHRARINYATLAFSHSATSDCNSMLTSMNTETSYLSNQPTGAEGKLISISSSGGSDPEWTSNLQGDYMQREVDLLSTSTLVAWGFQVARGMEYLASRRVLHGDLAARNVLLADNNVVKICDFGLAKSIYNNNEYQKSGNGPLPLKWMAIESVQDRIFSTQSDVWSFGIVLWELFSLARTPYPEMGEYQKVFDKLICGYRMPRPQYATQKLYGIMLECWDYEPARRPSFTDLTKRLGSILEDNVREHYIELNEPFTKSSQEGEDYLSMVSPPTYQQPDRHYVNLPTITEKKEPDNPGYMDMRASRTPLNSTGSSDESIELKPMLNDKERMHDYNDDYLIPRDIPAHTAESINNPMYELTSTVATEPTQPPKQKAANEYGKINDVKTVKDSINFFENIKKNFDWRGKKRGRGDGGEASNHYTNV